MTPRWDWNNIVLKDVGDIAALGDWMMHLNEKNWTPK